MRPIAALLLGLAVPLLAVAAEGNRLAHLDAPADPYWVGVHAPRLITPQWIGEAGVEAAVVLAVDDMSEIDRYEQFLRPILDRLKQIDGRAPVSIMTKSVDAQSPQLQTWLREGVSIEAHTDNHPCPCLQRGDLAEAKATFDRCVDSLAAIPNSRTVAFRMPCCDSMNSVSPRFFREVFYRTTPAGHFLTMDSSVFMLYTAADPQLPRQVVLDADGNERFRKYLPDDRLMVNYVENYPYPFVIGGLCWELPCVVPSDWEAQHRNGVCSPRTVADLKAAVDATVVKQGVFSLCFHPHGWIAAEQVVDLIDHAVARHGKRIKFLAFRDVQQRLDQNLLGGQALRGRWRRQWGARFGRGRRRLHGCGRRQCIGPPDTSVAGAGTPLDREQPARRACRTAATGPFIRCGCPLGRTAGSAARHGEPAGAQRAGRGPVAL